MIAYSINLADLEAKVDACKPGWREHAETYAGTDSIWSQIKDVWIDLQLQKCAYCECKYGDKKYARINYDVEHFRPKNKVSAWPTPADILERPSLKYRFKTGAPSDKGYGKLTYNIQNYAVACKECNTIFKGTGFRDSGEVEPDYISE